MNSIDFLVFLIIAGIFQILMGANDGGVLLGSIISSNVIRPLFGVILLFITLTIAPLVFGTEVVKTLGTKIVPIEYITPAMLYGTIVATMVWVVFAQRIKYPVSISYTFVGALVGSAFAKKVHTYINKKEVILVFLGLVSAIFITFIISYLLTKIFNVFLRFLSPKASPVFKILQVISSLFLVAGYGANDAEKTLSLVYTASIIMNTNLKVAPNNVFVILFLSFLFIIGTLFFGANSLLTAGFRLMKSNPKETFLAQSITSVTVLSFARFGLPVSSTESLNMSVVGIGVAEKPYAVKYHVVRNLVLTWLVTVPMSLILSFLFTKVFDKII